MLPKVEMRLTRQASQSVAFWAISLITWHSVLGWQPQLHFNRVSSASELQISSGHTLDSCIQMCARYSAQCSGKLFMDLQILRKTSFCYGVTQT